MTPTTNEEQWCRQIPRLNPCQQVDSRSPPLSPPPTSPLPPLPTNLPFQILNSPTPSRCIQPSRSILQPAVHTRKQYQAAVASDLLQRKLFPPSDENEEPLDARTPHLPVQEMKIMPVANVSQPPHPPQLVHNPLAAFTFTEEVLTALPDYFKSVVYSERQVQSTSPDIRITEHKLHSAQPRYHSPCLMEPGTQWSSKNTSRPSQTKRTVTITNLTLYLSHYRRGTHLPLQDYGVQKTESIHLSEGSADFTSGNSHYLPQNVHKFHSPPLKSRSRAPDRPKMPQAPSLQLVTKEIGLMRHSSKQPQSQESPDGCYSATSRKHLIPKYPLFAGNQTKSSNTEHKSEPKNNGHRLQRDSEANESCDENAVVRSKKSKILWAIATILLVLIAATGILAGIIWKLNTLDRA